MAWRAVAQCGKIQRMRGGSLLKVEFFFKRYSFVGIVAVK